MGVFRAILSEFINIKEGNMNLEDTINLMLFMLALGIIVLISEAIADVIYKYLHIRHDAITTVISLGLFSLAYYHADEYFKRRKK